MTPLRVLIITEDDPLYVIRFFEVFFEEYPRREIEIVAVTIDEAFHESILKTAKRMWRFYGPVDFVRLGTRFALAKMRGDSISRLVRTHGLTELPCTSVNDAAYVNRARELQPDVIMSVAAPEIFRKPILDVAAVRCVNIHSGRLPKYRGMMPTFWQMLHDEDHVTVTVHEMAEQLDAGAVLGTVQFELAEQDSLDRVITGTKQAGARLMIDVLRELREGADTPRPLDMREKGYFSFPQPEDVRKFRSPGHRML